MSDTIDQIKTPPSSASPIAPGTLDGRGRPFDPARHIPKQHPLLKYWMPKARNGGPKKKLTASSSSASTSSQPGHTAPDASVNSSPSPAASPGAQVTMDDLIPLTDAPKPKAPAAAAPAASGEIPEVAPGDTPANGSAPSSAPASSSPAAGARADVSAGHEVAGDLAARVTYAVTGAIIGDHKKATAVGEEHKAMKSAYTAFFQHRGVVFVGTVALLLIIVSYCMGDARREEIIAVCRKFFGKKRPAEKTVVDIEARTVPEKPVTEKPADSKPSTAGFFGINEQ